MSYVYLQSERTLWTVGFYDPDGEWQSESDHSTPEKAAERVAYLNGGGDALELRGAIQQLKEQVTMLERGMIDLKTTAAFAPFAPKMERLRGKMDLLETVIAENAAMRQAIAEAKEVVERLEGEDDPYMPTDAEWAAYPLAVAAATDDSGELWLYRIVPNVTGTRIWSSADKNVVCCLKSVTPPADFRTTLRHRPAGI